MIVGTLTKGHGQVWNHLVVTIPFHRREPFCTARAKRRSVADIDSAEAIGRGRYWHHDESLIFPAEMMEAALAEGIGGNSA